MKKNGYRARFSNHKLNRLLLMGFLFGIFILCSVMNNSLENCYSNSRRLSRYENIEEVIEEKQDLFSLKSSAQANNICITEIYSAEESDADWIELYNPTGTSIDLTGWKITDGNSAETTEVDLNIVGTIEAGEIIVIGDDSSISTRNYTASSLNLYHVGDDLLLQDPNGNYIDVVLFGIGTGVNTDHFNTYYWNDNEATERPDYNNNGSIQRMNRTVNGNLEDNNNSADWERLSTPTPHELPQYIPPPRYTDQIKISEVMYGGDENEWIELVNNGTETVNITNMKIYSHSADNLTIIDVNTELNAYETYVIGEPALAEVDLNKNLSLIDSGDALELRDENDKIIDVVVWGTGSPSFIYGSENGWIGSENATGNLKEGSSIFRYNLTKTLLSDTNRSSDWFNTTNPTMGNFYQIEVGNILFSEIGMSEPSSTEEFVEIYNNLTWPVTLDGMVIWDYGGSTTEIEFTGNITIPALGVIVAGDNESYDYTAQITLKNDDEDLVLYRDSSRNYELDVIIYGNNPDNTYPWGPGTGWIGPENATGGLSSGTSLHRLMGPDSYLIDTNTSSDWVVDSISPGILPEYIPPPDYTKQIMISEVMYGGTENEWIELVNNGTTPVDLNNFKLYAYSDDNLTEIDLSAEIGAYETYVIGEPALAEVDLNKNLSLIDTGDVLELRNSDDEVIDVVVWGTGSSSFAYGLENGWIGSNNATGGLSEGNSIFRYNLTRLMLSDINKSLDWYTTSTPTPNGFYSLQPGDILITELYPHESNENEFLELFNNFTWPVTLDGMRINDFSQGDDEITFLGNITIPARSAFTAGENGSRYDYDTGTGLTLTTSREIVLYLGSLPIDVLLYGDGHTGTYPIGPNTGWNDVNNASTADWDTYESIQRLNGSNFELVDTNKSTDWEINDYTPGYIPEYVPPPPPPEAGNVSSVLITEVMVDPYDESTGEYIELFNTLDVAVNIGNWSIWRSKYWDGSAEVLLPLGLSIPARSYFLIIDDAAGSGYDFNCLNYSVSLSLTNSDPRDIILADTNKTIIDRMAYRDSWSDQYVDTIDPISWTDGGIYLGHEGYSLARIYDPQNNDEYIDTNSSSDWRYDVFPSIGQHTNVSYFLSRPITGDAQVIAFSSPDNSYDAIVNLFRKAKSTIDLSIYQFSSPFLMNELMIAMNRGVRVRLLLENSYPGASVFSTDTDITHEVVYVAQQIDNNENGTVKWEDKGWRYTHSKYFIVDNEVITISTENFKFTGIPKDPSAGNRGWGIAVNNSLLAQKYLNVFELDWSLGTLINETVMVSPRENDEIITGDYSPISSYQTEDITDAKFQTVVGPDETIDVIVDLIRRAKITIDCEIFYMYPTWNNYPGGANNNPLMRAIIEAADRGVDVKVIFDSTYYVIEGDNNNDEAASILKAHGVQVRFSKNEGGIEKFHVKAMIVDDEAVMISSLNWNENSATNNREIGIIVNSTAVTNYYVTLFNFDWEKQSSEDLPGEGGEEDGLPQTYSWLVWLPILAVAYIAILAVGYTIRYRGEKKEIKEQQARDAKRRAEEKNVMKQEEVELKQVPVDIDAIRNKMNTFYGDNVAVSHLDSQGIPKDTVIPSDFASEYIRINHELIEVGDLSRPIPEVILLKYDPNNYVVIEGKLELEFNIFDSSLKAKVRELSEEIQRLKTEEKTPLDELINNLQVTINKQKLKIMEYEQKRKNQP